MTRLTLLALALLLAACTVGPDYKKPETQVPPSFQEANVAAPTSDVDLVVWWNQFDDPKLHELVDHALRSNLDLRAAASRIRQARDEEAIAEAAGLPSIGTSASAARLHTNSSPFGAAGAGGQSMGAASQPMTIRRYSLGFDATWEIDVFGGVRRGIEAAEARSKAAVWDLHDAEVSLSAEVANDYLDLRAAQARLAIVQSELQRQRDTLDLVSARQRAGFVSELDVNQQQTQLAATEARVPPLEAEVRAMFHALSILLGLQPEQVDAELVAPASLPAFPTELPASTPSDVLRRRPDIREAERTLAAATAEVGVAVADLYPKFNLLGLASFGSSSLDDLLAHRNFATLGAGIIQWPIFQGGRIDANIKASEEQRTQAYLAYQKTVLVALADVEDALARFHAEQQRLTALQTSANAASSTVAIAASQYRAGLVSFLNLLTAQTTLLDSQDQVIESREALARDLVSLYKAMGGGWSPTEVEKTD